MTSFAVAQSLYSQGRVSEAEALCQVLRESRPEREWALALLAEIRLSAGRMAEAISDLRELGKLNPADAANWRRLGWALFSVGDSAGAVLALERSLAIDPGSVRGHNNLGQALLKLERPFEAAACFERALALQPNYAIGRLNLALALELTQRPALALAEYDRLIGADASAVLAWSRRGALLLRMIRPVEALASLDTALALRPDDLSTLTARAAALLALGRVDEALAAAEAVLARDPNSVEALKHRAAALREKGCLEEALLCLERALDLAPKNVELWCRRATVHGSLGDMLATRRCLDEALRLDGSLAAARAIRLATAIAPVPASIGETDDGRRQFERDLDEFEEWLTQHELTEVDAWDIAQQLFFYFSYPERANKPLLQRYRCLAAGQLARWNPHGQQRLAGVRRKREGRLRLGIVSAHFFDHSVFQALTSGWLERLDRDLLETTAFYLGNFEDAHTKLARQHVDRFIDTPRGVADWARTIAAGEYDAILYPELGIDRRTLGLASLRLAPLQLVSWGHPETSGLPTIDVFLSGEAFEPPGAEAHYSERLMPLPNLGTYLRHPQIEWEDIDPGSFGIRTDVPWFVCPGTPYKYQPEYDAVLIAIAHRVPGACFVFFDYYCPSINARLQHRLRLSFAAAGLDAQRQLLWLPWQPRRTFVGLMRSATVFLDTLGFSGFNTFMLALQAGLPAASFDGRFLRGRLGSGILRRLGLTELICCDVNAFVEVASRLATDRDYRAEIVARLRSSAPLLYEDPLPVGALQTYLLR